MGDTILCLKNLKDYYGSTIASEICLGANDLLDQAYLEVDDAGLIHKLPVTKFRSKMNLQHEETAGWYILSCISL